MNSSTPFPKLRVFRAFLPGKESVLAILILTAAYVTSAQDTCDAYSFFGSEERSTVQDVVLGPDGTVYMVGNAGSDIDISLNGESSVIAFDGQGCYLAKYDVNKELLWVKPFAAESDVNANTLCVTEDQIFIGGNFTGVVDFDPGPNEELSTIGGAMNAFLLSLDLDGVYLWHAESGVGEGIQSITDIAIAEDGGVIAVGAFTVAIDLNPDLEEEAWWSTAGVNDMDGFMVKLSSSGNYEWSSVLNGISSQLCSAICATNNGWAVVGFSPTSFSYTTTTSESAITEDAPTTDFDSFMVLLDDSGSFQNGALYGCEGEGRFMDVVSNLESGNIFVSGICSGPGDYDSGPDVASPEVFGGWDIVVVCYTENMEFEWLRTLGGYLDDGAYCIALADNQKLDIAGFFRGPLEASGGLSSDLALEASGYPYSSSPDALHVRLTQDGIIEYTRAFGAEDLDRFEALLSSQDMIILGGHVTLDNFTSDCIMEFADLSTDYQGFVYWDANFSHVDSEFESVADFTFDNLIRITESELFIQLLAPGEVTVYDLSGRAVDRFPILMNETSVPTDDWPQGVYIFNIEFEIHGRNVVRSEIHAVN